VRSPLYSPQILAGMHPLRLLPFYRARRLLKSPPVNAKAAVRLAIFCFFLIGGGAQLLKANVPGGIVSSSTTNVTLTDNGSTVTLANGIISIVITKADASIHTFSYTYNNGGGSATTQLLNGGTDGGELYWTGNPAAFGTMNFTYSIVSSSTSYAEIALVSTSATDGIMEVHYSMLKGSSGFYCTPILTHRSVDGPVGLILRPNIYAGSIFNWMSVDANRNKLMEVSPTATSIPVPTAPKECYLWTNGIYEGRYDDKYKYSADLGTQRVWGWSSVGPGGDNIGIWNVSASVECYPGGPMERSLMEHIGTTILNVFTGGYYGLGFDNVVSTGESWYKVYGPYFYYCNNVATSVTDPFQASQTLYNDALAQVAAEKTAWPYSWFTDSDYVPASGRGTVTGTIVISDSGNPNASAANLWVGVVPEPNIDSSYDFQEWAKPYQFWAQTDSGGNFTIPTVISGTGYTLYAFGAGAAGTFMSQYQTSGTAPLLYSVPSAPFSVTVNSGSTTSLGTITWKPARVGSTVFEIGYPDRTGRKFRHGDDYWVGDIGASPTIPSPVWSKFMEYPYDFPSGPGYVVGASRWGTDWNFIQPSILDSAGNWDPTSSNISFSLPSGTSLSGSASFYLGVASDYYSAIIVTVNGQNMGSVSGLSASPNASVPTTGYYVGYGNADTNIREGVNGGFSDERLTFPASILKTGTNTNTINIGFRQIGGSYFADHAMYDYLRLELTGYTPPAPAGVTAYAGNGSTLLSWPVTPGATSYNIGRSTISGGNYSTIATGVTGPVCGSGFNNATWLDTTATNGNTYYYVVQSANTTGTSVTSAQSIGVAPSSSGPTSVPAAPTGLAATAGVGQVALGWTAPSNANFYIVQRSTLANNGGTILSSSVTIAETYNTLGTITLTNTTTGTTYTDTTPTNGCTYQYTVTAVNASGTGSASTSVNAVPLATAPTTATTVTATPGDEEVSLTWTAVPNAVGYDIEVATSLGGPYTLLTSVPDLTYTATGLSDGATYYYEVVAANSGGSSAASAAASATTALPAPTSLTATPGDTQVTLNWPTVAGATSYLVQSGTTTGGPYTTIGTSLGTSYTENSLVNGSTYYYVVSTTDANGTGPNSTEANATPVSTVPVAPTNLTATAGNAQVTLNWTPSVSATAYVVREATNSGGPYTTLSSIVTSSSYTQIGLSNGTTYYYVVAATSSGGTGANSNEASAIPNANLNLTWSGGVSTAWDTTTGNWVGGSGTTHYVDGDTVLFSDTAVTATVVITGSYNPGLVTFNNSVLNYSVNGTSGGMISGATNLLKSGSANVTLAGSNTFTGSTAISGGTLTLANTQALLDSTVTLNPGGTLSFGALTSSTFAGLSGAGMLSLTSTGGAAVTLSVGYNGQASAYSGNLGGSGGSLTKIGAGTFALSGTNTYTGGMTTSNGILSISTGAVSQGSTANVTGGQLQLNGGSLTCNSSSNITAGSVGLLVNSGTASFNGGLTTDAGTDNNIFAGAAGGVLNMASLFLGRSGLSYTSQPAAGATATGLYVSGGTVTISGQLNVCNNLNSNSTGSVRIDSGALTVGSTTTITLNNGSRWSVLDINGGTFTSNDATGAGIKLGGVFAGANAVMLVRNGAAYTDKITFGDTNQTSGSDVLSVTGGILYAGSGGMVLGGAGAYGYSISLSGTGTLGASASWSSPLNITLGGDTIQTGDAFGNSYNITLTGAVTGTTLKKTGNGTLLLAGPCSLTGSTSVLAGILEITGTLSGTPSVSISSGATLYLAGGSLSVSGSITNNGIFKISGTPSLALTGSFINNGVLDLINGPSTLPANFVNHGTILKAGNIAVRQVAMSGASFNLTIQSYLEHTYQLQRATTLTNPVWTNVGSAQAGTGSNLVFTDPAPTGSNGFYQIVVSA
jgi:rhamnogalacturonan endolyase